VTRPLLLLLLFSGPALADDGAAARKTRATALWDEGASKYDAGRFDEAIVLFEQAYEVWPYPEILFNLCQAWRQKEDHKKARFYCRSYLRNRPDAPNAADVGALVDELDRLIEAKERNARQPPRGVARPGDPSAAPPATEAWYADRWGWIAAGAGAAGVAAGVALVFSAAELRDDAARAATEFDRRRLRVAADDRELAGLVAGAAGLVALGAGVVLLIRNPGRDRVAVAVGPGWIRLRGSF
jgi:tetratricopeptide (TPR) repeat protein